MIRETCLIVDFRDLDEDEQDPYDDIDIDKNGEELFCSWSFSDTLSEL